MAEFCAWNSSTFGRLIRVLYSTCPLLCGLDVMQTINVLYRVEPVLGSDRKVSKYTTAIVG
jgi:hypothetical protein